MSDDWNRRPLCAHQASCIGCEVLCSIPRECTLGGDDSYRRTTPKFPVTYFRCVHQTCPHVFDVSRAQRKNFFKIKNLNLFFYLCTLEWKTKHYQLYIAMKKLLLTLTLIIMALTANAQAYQYKKVFLWPQRNCGV